MNVEKELLELIKTVAGLQAQFGTMIKIFVGIAIGSGVNLILNINAHITNRKK